MKVIKIFLFFSSLTNLIVFSDMKSKILAMSNQQLLQEHNDTMKLLKGFGSKAPDKGKKLAIYLESMIAEMGKLIKLFSFIKKK